MDTKVYFKKLMEQELIQSFEEEFPKDYDFSLILFDRENLEEDQAEARAKAQYEALRRAHHQLLDHKERFDESISRLAMPLRFSLMVPISMRRIQIFEPQIVDLIDHFVDQCGFTYEEQMSCQTKQAESFWQTENERKKNDGEPERYGDIWRECRFKIYQIALEEISKRPGKLEVQKPFTSEYNDDESWHEKGSRAALISLLEEEIAKEDTKDHPNYIMQEARDQVKDPNRLAQRRIYVTPTVVIIPPMQIEQSNQILRKLKYLGEYLIRVNILNENF